MKWKTPTRAFEDGRFSTAKDQVNERMLPRPALYFRCSVSWVVFGKSAGWRRRRHRVDDV